MTHRERFQAVIEGEIPDRLPWTPRLELWYRAHNTQGNLPPKYAGKTLAQIREMLNCGHPGRENPLFKSVMRNVEIIEKDMDSTLLKTYITPVGEVSELYRVDKEAKSKGYSLADGQAEYMVKDRASYDVVRHILENIEYVPMYDEFTAYQTNEVGDNGECVPSTGYDPTGYDPFYRLMEKIVGLSYVYYHLADYPDQMEMLYHTMWENQRKLWKVLVESSAKTIIHGSHYDSLMTPPPIFKKYMLPYLKELSKLMHDHGKRLAIHADADSKLLLELYMEAGVDVMDCYCTAPMAKVTMEETIDRIGDKMVIWGGIPSNLLVPEATPYKTFREYIDNYFDLLKKRRCRVIVAVADNVVAEADIERVEEISDKVDKFRF